MDSDPNTSWSLRQKIVTIMVVAISLFFGIGLAYKAKKIHRRNQIKSNLKNIAIALHEYHERTAASPGVEELDFKGTENEETGDKINAVD